MAAATSLAIDWLASSILPHEAVSQQKVGTHINVQDGADDGMMRVLPASMPA